MNDPIVIGAFATICAAVVGAIATIVAALISRKQTTKSKNIPNLEMDEPVEHRSLEDGVFEIHENRVLIISEIDLTITNRMVILDDQVNFEYRTQDMEQPVVVKNAQVGFQKMFQHSGKIFMLTLVRIDGLKKDVYFDLRKVTKKSIHRVNQPVETKTPKLPQSEKNNNEIKTFSGFCPHCGGQYLEHSKPGKCPFCGSWLNT